MNQQFSKLISALIKETLHSRQKCAVPLYTDYFWDSYRHLCNKYNRAVEDFKKKHDLKLRHY